MACTRRLPEPRTPDGASQPPPVSCSRRLRLIDEAAHIVCDRESTAVDRILQTPLVVRRVVRIFRVVLNASRAQLVDLPMQIADQGGYGVAVIHTREFPGRWLRGLPQGPCAGGWLRPRAAPGPRWYQRAPRRGGCRRS